MYRYSFWRIALRTNPLHLAAHIARISQWSSFRSSEELTGVVSQLVAGSSSKGASSGFEVVDPAKNYDAAHPSSRLPSFSASTDEEAKKGVNVPATRTHARTHTQPHIPTFCIHFFSPSKYDTMQIGRSSVYVLGHASLASWKRLCDRSRLFKRIESTTSLEGAPVRKKWWTWV